MVLVLLSVLLSQSTAQAKSGLTELPNLDVLVDDSGFTAGQGAMAGNNSIFLPLSALVNKLTDKKGKVVLAGKNQVEIYVGARLVAQFPLNRGSGIAEAVPTGTILSPARVSVTMPDPPVLVDGTVYASIDSIAPIFGTSYQVDSEQLHLFSPKYWANKLEISAGLDGLNASMAGRYLDFGVSPPAASLMIWARPDQDARVQIYGLNNAPPYDRTPQPLLFSLDGRSVDVADPDSGAEPTPRTAGPAKTVRILTQPQPVGKVARYAALILYKPLPAGVDPIDAINKGSIRSGEWGVVGIQQTIQRTPMRFEILPMGSDATFASFAAHHDMPESLLREMNGLTASDKPAKDRRLVVVAASTYDPDGVDQPDVRPYEVGVGESIQSLMQKWGISREDFLKSNPSYGAGREVAKGELVYCPATAASAPAASQNIKVDGRSYLALRASNLYTSSDRSGPPATVLPANSAVTVSETVGNMAKTTFARRSLYVAMADLRLIPDSKSSLPPGTREDPTFAALPPGAYDPEPTNRLARVALSMLGAPYHFGGSSLQTGIDCSNFVALAFSRAHLPVPPPPVTTQETVGTIVHVNNLSAVVNIGNRRIVTKLPNSQQFPYGTTSLSALRRGDRIIIQRDPLGMWSGSRHTGIYLGRVKVGDRVYQKGVINASSHRGIVVDEITASWIWEDYRYSVRSDLSGKKVALNR